MFCPLKVTPDTSKNNIIMEGDVDINFIHMGKVCAGYFNDVVNYRVIDKKRLKLLETFSKDELITLLIAYNDVLISLRDNGFFD